MGSVSSVVPPPSASLPKKDYLPEGNENTLGSHEEPKARKYITISNGYVRTLHIPTVIRGYTREKLRSIHPRKLTNNWDAMESESRIHISPTTSSIKSHSLYTKS